MLKRIFDFEDQFHMLIVSIMIVAIAVVAILAVSAPTEDFRLRLDDIDSMDKGWIDIDSLKEYSDADARLKPGGELKLRRTLPENIGENSVIGYYDAGLRVNAYVDGRRIYEAGLNNSKQLGHEMGACWRRIAISPDLAGRDITIIFVNDSDATVPVNFGRMYMGAGSDIYLKLIENSVLEGAIILVCLVIAIFLIVLTVILWKSGYMVYFYRIRALATFTLLMGIWVFADGNILQVMASNASIRYVSAHILFMLIPICTNRYFSRLFDEAKRGLRAVLNANEVAYIFVFIAYINRTIHISDSLFIAQGFMGLVLTVVGHYAVKTYVEDRNRYNLGSLLSYIVLVAVFMTGLYQYYITDRNQVGIDLGIGYLVFIFITLATQIRYILSYYRKQMRAKDFKQMASVDPITGGDSSVVIEDHLNDGRIFEKGNPWFLHMDFIGFSNVNISLGWANGNKIIKGLYNIFKEQLAPSEVVSNIGNAGFAFVLNPGRNIDDLCNNLTRSLNQYLDGEWGSIILNVRYAASKVHQGEKLGELLDHSFISFNSQIARLSVKSNCYYYDDECQKEAKRQYEIESKIVKALENEEFVMYLQPKVDPVSEKVVGAETLIRWNSESEGMISPGAFIPVAEKSGQIGMLDLYMFKKTCQYLKHRLDAGRPMINVSVNVSKFGMDRVDFFDAYERIMKETGVPTQYLEFEITESMAFERVERLEAMIERIHELGAVVSMDDFGSAYSNLASISKLNFDVVKMDKVFFDAGFPENRHQYILVRNLIETFHNMEIEVVCEGVETREQKDALLELGCDMIQGFYYSRPLPEREFDEYETF